MVQSPSGTEAWLQNAVATVGPVTIVFTIGYVEIRGALVGRNWAAILKWPEIEETFVAWPLMQRILLCDDDI
jgi:hypothetical protein